VPTIVDHDAFSFTDTTVSPVGVQDTESMQFAENQPHKTSSSTSGSGCVVTVTHSSAEAYTPGPV
jgi:hypothetical protein